MPITVRGVEYLVGPAMPFRRAMLPMTFGHIDNVEYMGNNCPVFYNAHSLERYLKVQHTNSEWPTFYPLKTKASLLQGWN